MHSGALRPVASGPRFRSWRRGRPECEGGRSVADPAPGVDSRGQRPSSCRARRASTDHAFAGARPSRHAVRASGRGGSLPGPSARRAPRAPRALPAARRPQIPTTSKRLSLVAWCPLCWGAGFPPPCIRPSAGGGTPIRLFGGRAGLRSVRGTGRGARPTRAEAPPSPVGSARRAPASLRMPGRQ